MTRSDPALPAETLLAALPTGAPLLLALEAMASTRMGHDDQAQTYPVETRPDGRARNRLGLTD